MNPIELTVNGKRVAESVEPRMHLADFLRERLNLTATHLRCEQGACGACTLLIDGQPARSCITYTAMCDGAAITTIEGLHDDAVMIELRRAFSEEHALQCGYCTPGMLMTARDIVLRLPDADEAHIRTELSGNLCRCTGYVGIVRAVRRVLGERRQFDKVDIAYRPGPIGPVGAHPPRAASDTESATLASAVPPQPAARASTDNEAALGLAGRQPNVELQQSFNVSQPPDEVWQFFADVGRVVSCLPGAALTQPPVGDRIDGTMAVKLGPITARFAGQARIVRDEARQRGVIMGAGNDQTGGSRAAGEAEYTVEPGENGGTRVVLTIRALLVGPLAQFSRGAIVEDLVARITEMFARRLEAGLSGAFPSVATQAPLKAGSLLQEVLIARLKHMVTRLFGRPRR